MKEIGSEHPLTRSKWLWPQGNIYLQNCHAQFRHDFELQEIPSLAPLFITADQSYRLYVNGQYVCRGPARGYQSHWPFDEIDLAPYLRQGHNFIAVEAYNPGIGTFQYLHHTAAGFICAAEWNNVQIHTSKATWQMRRAPGNNPQVARLSHQMSFQEDFDANKDDLFWIESFDAPVWHEDEMFRWRGEIPYGQPPWNTLEMRGIPLLREKPIIPVALTVHGAGMMEPGWQNCFNIAWQWMKEEAASVKEWHSGATLNAKVGVEGLGFEVVPVKEGEFHAVVVNLGAIEIGTFGIEVSGCIGNEIIDCLYYQYLEDGVPVDLLPVSFGLLALATRLRTAPGVCRRMFYQLQGAKFIVLVCRNLSQTLKLKAMWRTAEYPFTMRGTFKTSDHTLNEIHYLCRHTQQICSSDAYIDTPWREQGQWWGDARIQGKNTFFLDGDSRLLRRGIYSIAGQKTENELTYGVAPCCSGGCILPDFSLTWILTIFDYYWQTGSLEIFHDQHYQIKQILAYFKSPEASETNGLLKYDSRYWLFEDWASLAKEGCPTFLNLWHLYTLQHYEKLLRAAKQEKEADAVANEIVQRRQLIITSFFDEKQKLFIGGKNHDGTITDDNPSLHDQVLAILTGLKPELHHHMVEQRLIPFLRGKKTDYAVPTSFWCNYLFDAAKYLGYDCEVLEFIRDSWGKMIPSGGTWEQLVWDKNTVQSCCHAWSSHPASHLVEILAGLRQTAPAWQRVAWQPLIADGIARAEAMIPTPQGDLSTSWQRKGNETLCHIDIPTGITVDAELPGLVLQSLSAGRHCFVITQQAVMAKEVWKI